MYHLVARGIYLRWQNLIFLFMYMVQLYKEDWTILHMLGCQAIALPSTEQIVKGKLQLLFTMQLPHVPTTNITSNATYMPHMPSSSCVDITNMSIYILHVNSVQLTMSPQVLVYIFPIIGICP